MFANNAKAIDFTSTTRNYFRFGSKKFSCKTKKKEVARCRKCLRIGKNHPVKQPGCYYVNKTSIQISLFGCTLFQTLSTCRGCNSRIVLVFIPKLLAQNKKRFVSISVEWFYSKRRKIEPGRSQFGGKLAQCCVTLSFPE